MMALLTAEEVRKRVQETMLDLYSKPEAVSEVFHEVVPDPLAPVLPPIPSLPSANPRAVAEKMIQFGSYCMLIPFGTKRATASGWQESATRNLSVVQDWTDGNVCVVGKQDGNWYLEFEFNQLSVLEDYEKTYGPLKTYRVKSPSGGVHLHFKQNAQSWSMGNLQEADESGKEMWSARVNNRYVLAPGAAAHPQNDESRPLVFYTALDKSAPVEAPDSLLMYLKSRAGKPKSKSVVTEKKIVAEGGRNNHLASYLGKLRQTMSMDEEQLLSAGRLENEKSCVPPLDDTEVQTIAHSIAGYAIKKDRTLLVGGKVVGENAPESVEEPEVLVEFPEYAMTAEEIEAEHEKAYPRIMLAAPAGPTCDDDILYGPAGQLTKEMAEYNEGHPAGIYLNLLVSLGSAFGRHAHFRVGPTRHFTNEFLANVGVSSYGRKGGARDAVNEFMKIIDPEWSKGRTRSGFGSGEAIIGEIKDDMEQTIPLKGKNGAPPKFEKITVPGVADKRLCIREPELASVMTMAGKPDSLAGAIIRNGWDGSPLGNNVKGQGKSGISMSARCEEPHLSITGDISADELKACLPEGSENNGFGNRFLYCYVYRTKLCSNGGPDIDYSKYLLHFHTVIEHAKKVEVVPLSRSAQKVWSRMYTTFDEAKKDDMTGKMTSRGPAHVRRLAMILALIDLSETVETEHLHAAKAIWDYTEESARFIFSGTTLDQMKLLEWVRKNGPVTVGQMRRKHYHDNMESSWVKAQLLDLVRQGRLAVDGENFRAKA